MPLRLDARIYLGVDDIELAEFIIIMLFLAVLGGCGLF